MSTPSTGRLDSRRPPAQRTDSPLLPPEPPEHDLGVLSLPELRHVKLYESTHAKRVTVQREVERQIEARLTA